MNLFPTVFENQVVQKIQDSSLEDIPDKDDLKVFYEFLLSIMPEELTVERPTLRGVHDVDGIQVNLYSLDLHKTAIGSFKGGAFYAMWWKKKQGEPEVVTCSAGNHAQGVAYSAARLGIKAHIYMPKGTSEAKVNATKNLGGEYVEIHLVGDTYDDAAQAATTRQKENNLSLIHPFDDPDVIDAQGVHFYKLWKLMEQNRQKVDLILVPGGGGGLLSGTTLVRTELSPDTILIGVEGEGSDCIACGLEGGEPVPLGAVNGYAQGMAVKTVGSRTLKMIQENKSNEDVLVTVNNGQIALATTAFRQKNERVETAGATATASLMTKDVQSKIDHLVKKAKESDQKQVNVVSVISGGNITPEEQVQRKFEAEIYSRTQRHYEIELPQNIAGILQKLTAYFADKNVNIRSLDYSTNQLQTENNNPFVTIGLQPREGDTEVLDEVERWMQDNGYAYNDISRQKAEKVASCMGGKETQFSKENAQCRPGYSKVTLQIRQQPGSLNTILEKFKKSCINVELFVYEERSQEEDYGSIQIGISQANKKPLSEEQVKKILGDEYILVGVVEDIRSGD